MLKRVGTTTHEKMEMKIITNESNSRGIFLKIRKQPKPPRVKKVYEGPGSEL